MNRRLNPYTKALANYWPRRRRGGTSSGAASLSGRGGPMSARHRAEDLNQVSLMDLLATDEHSPQTVLVYLFYPTPRGDRQITVRRLSAPEQGS